MIISIWALLTVVSLVITHQYLTCARGGVTSVTLGENTTAGEVRIPTYLNRPRLNPAVLMAVSKVVESAGNSIIEQINAFEIVEESDVEETRYVDIYKVNVREEPSLSSEILTTLVATEDVDVVSHVVTDRDEEWVRVNMADTDSYGYIMKEYTTTEAPWICIGYYHITWYCPCEKCCDVANRPTASGKMPTAGRTIAADKSLPFGTEVIIEGHTYTVEDRGGAIKGNRIDIFAPTHEEALSHKSRTVPVYIRKYV